MPDPLPKAPAGEFLFGYPSQYADFSYPVPEPPALGRNGSFMAFRILAQDCRSFEQFLTQAARQTGYDRELIAAKLCGRWRNGVPLLFHQVLPGKNSLWKNATFSTTFQAATYPTHSTIHGDTAVPWVHISGG